ncbi:hypothetical protein [Streptomyces sp. NPDC003077]|uniref:hypothetical protein n=1 Tax=Streptomyces sp. NPDC003077 TaxID=3154443 RepID=UPI00339F5DAB
MAARKSVALAAAVLLVLEGLGILLLNWILGLVVDRQQMSLAGVDPGVMSVGAWVGGGLFALFLFACAYPLARCGLRDHAPGRFARIVLITCAVVHGLLAAVTVGPFGWAAFVVMMAVVGLIVLTLMMYGETDGVADGAPGGKAGDVTDGPSDGGGTADPGSGGGEPGGPAPAST